MQMQVCMRLLAILATKETDKPLSHIELHSCRFIDGLPSFPKVHHHDQTTPQKLWIYDTRVSCPNPAALILILVPTCAFLRWVYQRACIAIRSDPLPLASALIKEVIYPVPNSSSLRISFLWTSVTRFSCVLIRLLPPVLLSMPSVRWILFSPLSHDFDLLYITLRWNIENEYHCATHSFVSV